MTSNMEVSFDEVNWASVGMVIEEDTPKEPVIRKPAPLVIKPRKPWLRVITLISIILMIGVVLVSFMLRDADAAMALMKFTVKEVTETHIVVIDNHKDEFVFRRNDDAVIVVGQEITVATEFTYAGGNAWIWNTRLTMIIE